MKAQSINQAIALLHNKDFRANLLKDPHQYARQLGYEPNQDTDFIVKRNTPQTIYVVFPEDDNENLIREMRAGVKSGTTGTAGTAASASTLSSVTTTAGSASTLGSIATAGSVQFKV